MPVAVIENDTLYFVRADHIGRPVFATNDLGVKVWEASYLPFGGVQTSTGTPMELRFPGQWFQSESGLHQNWMRDYDPTTGRYIQADPLGLVDGASVYGYALQNPGRYVDPRGENAGCFAGPWGCAAGGVVTGAAWGWRAYRAYRAAKGAADAGKAAAAASGGNSEECGDDCEKIAAQIEETLRELKKRFRQWRRNQNKLIPGEPAASRRRGSFGGHVQQIWDHQRRLEALINEAKAKGCQYNPEADIYVNKPIPFPGAYGG